MKKHLFLFLILLVNTLQAQTGLKFPVDGLTTINPPVSSSLEDLANPINHPIQLALYPQDYELKRRQVYLELRIEGASAFRSNNKNNPFELFKSTYVTNQTMASLFAPENMRGDSYNKPLQAGIYTFVFTVRDAFSDAILSAPIESAPIWIESSDPPLPLYPINYTGVVPSNPIQNVVFQWLPRHTPNINIEYEFTLAELPIANRGNVQNVFLSQPPILKYTTAFPSLVYDGKFPQLRKGAVYAWRVQAKPKLGASNKASTFLNSGFSEIFSFIYDNYQTELSPPRNLLVERSPDYSRYFVDFQGDDNHANYSVVFSYELITYIDDDPDKGVLKKEYFERDNEYHVVEKGKNNETKFRDKPINSSRVYYKTKIVVRARDVFGHESEPVEYIIEPITSVQFNNIRSQELTLEGTVDAYIRSVPGNESFINELNLDRLEYLSSYHDRQNFQPILSNLEKRSFVAKDVRVCVILSQDTIEETTLKDFERNEKNKHRVWSGCVKTDANGKYSITNPNLTIGALDAIKHVYLTFKSPNDEFSNTIAEVSVPKLSIEKVRKIKTESLQTNTYLFIPKFIYEDGTVIPNKDFEEINLYRLKSAFENNKDLYKNEVGASYTPLAQTFNKDAYVKVGNLLKENGHFFNNETDQFILGVKETDFDMRFFSVNKFRRYSSERILENQSRKNELPLEVHTFTYHPPLARIKGQVAVRGRNAKQVFPAANIEVGIIALKNFSDFADVDFDRVLSATKSYEYLYKDEVKTDENGNYTITIPEKLFYNQDVEDLIVYNRIHGVYNYYQAKRIPKPKTDVIVDIDLESTGAVFASRLYNQHNEPVSGAKIVHKKSGAFTTTNHLGEFIVNIPYSPALEQEPTFIIEADGYTATPQKLSDFTKTAAPDETTDYGLAFWNENIASLKELTGGTYEEISEEEIHRQKFKYFNTKLISFYKKDSIKVEGIEYVVRVKLFTSDEDEKKESTPTYTQGTIEVNGELVDIPEDGLVKAMYTRGTVFAGKIRNKDKKAEVYYVESDFEVEFDEPENKRDTIDIEIEIKQAIYVAGIITGYTSDSTKIGPEGKVTISVEDMDDVETDENGHFEIWLEKDAEEVKLTLTKDAYNTTEVSFSTKAKTEAEKTKDFVSDTKDDTEYTTFEALRELELAIYAKDETIPDFKTLQGFNVDIATIIKVDDKTFIMKGSINLEDEKSIYELEEGEELTFEDLEVTIDKFDKTNAVLVEEDTEFDQETLSLKLFGYADVESNSENEGIANFVRLEKLKLEGRESYGKIGGISLKFLPKKMLRKVQDILLQEFELTPTPPEQQGKIGLNNDITKGNKTKLLNENAKAEKAGKTAQFDVKKEGAKEPEKKELIKYKEREKDAPLIPVFVSGGKSLANFNEDLEFKIEYPEGDLNGVKRRVEKGSTTGKKESITMSLGSGFSIIIDETQEATLSKNGVVFMGSLGLPAMKKIGIEGKMPLVEKLLLAPDEELPMRELRLKKKPDSTGKTTPYFTLGVANSWRFEVTKFQVFDEFSSVGFGGKIYTDKTNHLIVHSMSIRKGPDGPYPFLDMEFPKEGFKVKAIVLKSPEGQRILCGYNFEDKAYEIEAGVKLDITKNASKMMKEIFPLEIEKFVYNTAGKFFVSINLGKTISVGPVKINIRKVMFNKGGGVSWPEMKQMLQRTTEENMSFKTVKYNNANYRETNKNSTINRNANIDANALMEETDEVKLATGEVDWAMGFAGGVEINSLKGVKTKADASFVIGEREGDFAVEFNTIDILMESTAFKGFMSLEIATEGDRVGFAGRGEMETLTRKWAASVKFFKLPNGIEFGVSLVASAMIATGPVTWTSVGGGIDINTATNKYSVFFLGSAVPTGTAPDVSEFRAIKIEVLFETDECGPLPVVKGSADWYLKNDKFCNAKMAIDFCRLTVFLNINCSKEVLAGIRVDMIATAYITSKSIFLGANIKTVLLGVNANGVLMIGIKSAFVGKDVPLEVKYYKDLIAKPELLKGDDKVLNGIYIGATMSLEIEESGDYVVFAWSIKLATSNKTITYKAFDGSDLLFSNDFKFSCELYAKIGYKGFSISAYGSVKVRALLEGGYNSSQGFNFMGNVAASLEVGNSPSTRCWGFGLEWCGPFPCGLNWKFCIGGSFLLQYRQRGLESGVKIKLDVF
jgi:hypothetical protein